MRNEKIVGRQEARNLIGAFTERLLEVEEPIRIAMHSLCFRVAPPARIGQRILSEAVML